VFADAQGHHIGVAPSSAGTRRLARCRRAWRRAGTGSAERHAI
jgi:hypothetical protein